MGTKNGSSVSHDICSYIRRRRPTQEGDISVIERLADDCLGYVKTSNNHDKLEKAIETLHNIRSKAKNDELIGAFTAKKIGKTVYIGWSKCSEKDAFNKHEAIELANRRIETRSRKQTLPLSLLKDYKAFVDRCSKYYKGAKIKKIEVRKDTRKLNMIPISCSGLCGNH